MAEWQPDIAEFLGVPIGAVQELEHHSPQDREEKLLGHYRSSLKAALPPQRSPFIGRTAYVRVLDPSRERAKYHLVYLSSHPKGTIEFMTISHGVEAIQQRVRADRRKDAREEASGIRDMFADEMPMTPGSASGLPKIACMTAPLTASAAPTSAPFGPARCAPMPLPWSKPVQPCCCSNASLANWPRKSPTR